MNKKLGFLLLFGVIIVGAGLFAFNAVLGTPEAPSAPIEAVPLNTPVPEPIAEATVPPTPIPPTAIPTEAPTSLPPSAVPTDIPPTQPPAVATEEVQPTLEPTAVPPTVTSAPTATPVPPTVTPAPTAIPPTSTPQSLYKVFRIDPNQSSVSFSLGEVLRGEDVIVVGTTNQVAAEIGFDLNNPQATQIGTVLINARTFVTDDEFRNRAIQNAILDTADFEFITFVPTSIGGVPASVTQGQAVSFQITGNLTIRDVTQQVTFQANVTLTSENTMSGNATTTISREQFNLTIPQVQSVASVDDEVVLSITFIANG